MSMTENEAIRRLKDHFRVHDDGRPTPYLDEAVSMAIKALEKVQALEENKTYQIYREYLSIGTVSEFRELKEKAIAKKPIPLDKHGEYHECSFCGCFAENHSGKRFLYCPKCGTEHDWSEGKE